MASEPGSVPERRKKISAVIAKRVFEVSGINVEIPHIEEPLLPEIRDFIDRINVDTIPILAYIVGLLIGDGDDRGRFYTKDPTLLLVFLHYTKSLGLSIRVKYRKNVFQTSQCAILGYAREAWRALARVRPREIISGLLDAEGCLSPRLLHDEQKLEMQLSFSITKFEIAKFVYDYLLLAGLDPKLYLVVGRPSSSTIDGKDVKNRKPLYRVYASLPISNVTLIEDLFTTPRERRLIEFAKAVECLTGELQYLAFLLLWRKNSQHWYPNYSSSGLPALLSMLQQLPEDLKQNLTAETLRYFQEQRLNNRRRGEAAPPPRQQAL